MEITITWVPFKIEKDKIEFNEFLEKIDEYFWGTKYSEETTKAKDQDVYDYENTIDNYLNWK